MELADTLAAFKEFMEGVNVNMIALKDAVDTVQAEVQGIKEAQTGISEKMTDTPFASRAAWTPQSIIGSDKARVDGRTSLAKDGPEEAPTNRTAHPLDNLWAQPS